MTEVTPYPLKTHVFQALLNFTVLRPPCKSTARFAAGYQSVAVVSIESLYDQYKNYSIAQLDEFVKPFPGKSRADAPKYRRILITVCTDGGRVVSSVLSIVRPAPLPGNQRLLFVR